MSACSTRLEVTSSIAAAVAGPGGAGRREAFALAVMASTSAEGEAGRSPSADGNGIVEDVEADPGAGLSGSPSR